MAKEIELKLSLRKPALLLRQPLLARAQSCRRQQLLNIYFDSPDQALRRRGIALRLRKQGRRWLQTVKCAGSGGGGLSSRPEWETPYTGQFDFSAIDDEATRRWLSRPALIAQLAPLFETRFTRTSWHFVTAPGCSLEMVLDRGHIAAGGRREPILEVELEVGSGPVDQLFALALELAQGVALLPLAASKAERGYLLACGGVAGHSIRRRAKPAANDWRGALLTTLERLLALQAGEDPGSIAAALTADLEQPVYSRMLLQLTALAHGVTLP